MKTLILKLDDWLAIYVGNNCVYQDHNIEPIEFLKLSEEHSFTSEEIKTEYIEDGPDYEMSQICGNLPYFRNELRGDY